MGHEIRMVMIHTKMILMNMAVFVRLRVLRGCEMPRYLKCDVEENDRTFQLTYLMI